MLERSCFALDREAPTPHKSGWKIWTYHVTTTVPGYERMEFDACDIEHATRNAKKWVKAHGGEVIEVSE